MSALKLSPAHAPTTMSRIGTQVFAGNLLLFAPSPAMRNLLAQVRKVARECFDISHPPHAHRKYSRDEFLRRAEDAQKRVNTAECKQLFAAVLDGLGISRKNLFWDTLGLRVAPPIQNADDLTLRGFRSFVPVHRDTWGAGFQSQINWWAPVWSLAARRTMGFYPSYWMRPLRNTSARMVVPRISRFAQTHRKRKCRRLSVRTERVGKSGRIARAVANAPRRIVMFFVRTFAYFHRERNRPHPFFAGNSYAAFG